MDGSQFLQRRYCRFINKKKHKPKMNVDEGVNFKVRRFLQDIDKYNEKRKKKKERKEAKINETNISLHKNKGIYKNAVLSFPGIKELNCSTSARLKGDLIALTKKPNEENETKTNEENLLERDTESKRETMAEKKDILDQHSDACSLTKSEFKKLQDLDELQQVLVNNAIDNATEHCYIERDSESRHCRSDKETNLVDGNKENQCFPELVINHVIEREEEKHEDNCNKDFELLTSKNKEGIFDLFNTPEKEVNAEFTLFNNTSQHSTPKWKAFNEDCPGNFNSEYTKHKSSKSTSLSKKFFEVTSRNNDQNNLPLYPEISIQYFKPIQPSKFKFLQTDQSDKIESTSLISSANCLIPLKLYNSDRKFNQLLKEIPCDNFERLNNNSPPYFIPKRDQNLVNVNDSYKEPFSFVDYSTKFNQKRIKWKGKNVKSNMKKNLLEEKMRDQYVLKKRTECKKELFNTKKPVLNCNQRFKNNLRFSPHKYC